MSPDSVKTSVLRKTYLRILAPLFIASVLAFLDRVNVSYAALTMNADLGFDAKVYGLAAGIFFAGYVLFEVPGAILAERWSPSRWIARILFSWGAVSILLSLVQNEWQFYLLRFMLGVCEASFYPVIYASVIPRWFVAETRARAISITLSSLLVSAIVGAPLAGWLVGLQPFGLKGWQSLFLLEGGVTMLYGGAVLLWLQDDPAEAAWLNVEEKRYLIDTLQAEKAATRQQQPATLRQALAQPAVLRLCLIYFLWITGFWGFSFWMPTVIKNASGWSPLAIGLASAVPMLAALAAMLWLGHSSSRRAEKRWHVAVPLLLAAAGFLIGTLSDHLAVALLSVTVVAIGVYSPMGVWWSIPTTFLTGTLAAGAIGLINSVGNIGGFIGPYALGLIEAATGSHTLAYLWLSASLLLSALLVLGLKPQAQTADNASQAAASGGR